MPLSVEVKINGESIDTLHIGRIDQLTDNSQVSNYLVSSSKYFDVRDSYLFTHKYSDGAWVCVQKALEAWGKRP